MAKASGVFRQLWFSWRKLKLPWRKRWMVGADLSGNTFWEFKDAINANRLRRIVHYSSDAHYADVKISPQWHQWLRHTRPEAPTIQEQHYEVARQSRMRQLAAEADARWASTPSFLDGPEKQQPIPAIGTSDPAGYMHGNQTEPLENEGVRSAVGDPEEVQASVDGNPVHPGRFDGPKTKDKQADPWKQRKGPGEEWQPDSWSPGVAPRR